MGGLLTVTSSVGEGSTFRFDAHFEQGSQSKRNAAPEIADFHGRRVLVIDDNATNRFILAETLKFWGIESAEFGAPAEALANLTVSNEAKRPYSLVLVDSEMPGMNGFETAALIKKIAPDLPVVMFTSDVQPGDVLRRRQAGLAGYAVKPVKRAELLRLLCTVMRPREITEMPAPGSKELKQTALIRPLRILIAEDSEDNRLLLEVYLKGSPHQWEFADNGKTALDLLAAEDFDLILMDMQMPVMDGLTATRAIRKRERELGTAAIPIIGLTANARAEDVALSVNAGCNQHLSKPISKHKLLNTIQEYGPLRASLDSSATGAGGAQTVVIKMLPGLEEIVPRYLAARQTELPQMLALLAGSGFERIAFLAHNMKGTGTPYGFPDLTRLGALLEQSARQSDAAALSVQLTDLGDYLGRVQLAKL
jgi:CheY-like chemotaxis protein/HPt (histidine-containing phosphotransfer) domain-containing protein